jgi:hypothetical protein
LVPVDFCAGKGTWRYCSIDDNPERLLWQTIRERVLLTVSKFGGLETLGPHTRSLYCQWDDEVSRLLLLQPTGANLRAGQHLPRADAWYALNHTINRTVEYPIMTYLTAHNVRKSWSPF